MVAGYTFPAKHSHMNKVLKDEITSDLKGISSLLGKYVDWFRSFYGSLGRDGAPIADLPKVVYWMPASFGLFQPPTGWYGDTSP